MSDLFIFLLQIAIAAATLRGDARVVWVEQANEFIPVGDIHTRYLLYFYSKCVKYAVDSQCNGLMEWLTRNANIRWTNVDRQLFVV